ncbi:toll-like receptor 2 [Ambystoma mexicanum]|uniref:toll-like receptor 2 n=1 Tax=Ambystoma mexicanum TaxID=8296 RepID=UPI0037E9C355
MSECSLCNVSPSKMLQGIGRLLALFTLIHGAAHLAHCQVAYLGRCPNPCTVNENNVGLCSGSRLSEVPKNLSTHVVELDLSHNEIRKISKTDFLAYTNLTVLNLAFNKIFEIENDSFASNLLLKKLNLFNNSLTEIPSQALSPLKELEELDMSNNLYVNSTLSDVFYSLKKLAVLSMGGTEIVWISKNDFLPLKNIILQKFALKTASSPRHYERGAFAVLNTDSLWCDFALDTNPNVLPLILEDLRGKSMTLLRLRNLFANSYYTDEGDLFSGLADIGMTQLVLFRGKFNEHLLRLLLLNVQKSNVTDLSLMSIDFARSFNTSAPKPSIQNLTLNKLLLQDISNPDILRFDWTFTWLSKVISLFIINVNFNYIPCDAWREMQNVVTLNISDNRLLNEFIYNPSCQNPSIPLLAQFNASNNLITSLKTISQITFKWPCLKIIDLSYNKIGSNNEFCKWGPAIKKFIMHHNVIKEEVFQCLPTSLHFLDLSNTELDVLQLDYFNRATNLSELWLSNNRIKFIPSNWESPNLRVLTLDGNSFGLISKGSFDKMPNLVQLNAGNNPFHCTCDLSMFIQENLYNGNLKFMKWPNSYTCYHPPDYLHSKVESYSPGMLECDVTLIVIISITSTALLVIVSMLLCWKFDIPWYVKATCQIIQSKYRSGQGIAPKSYIYHAFVSYSSSDADWVRSQLLNRLENCSPPYSICIHERDFLPGKWIIDNIIENIEKSRKVIFVLSHSFVNSEWCNYELYFAHHRCIGHAFDDVILVVKENVNLDSLPTKFCKLRKMLSKKTYLEWPSETSKQPFFWMKLKNVLGKDSIQSTGQEGMFLGYENDFLELPVTSGNTLAAAHALNSL